MKKPSNGAGVVYVRRNGEILVTNRPNDEMMYALPAGKMEEGETYISAAIREAEEETGLIFREEDLRLLAAHMHGENNSVKFAAYLHTTERVDLEYAGPTRRFNGTEELVSGRFVSIKEFATMTPFTDCHNLIIQSLANIENRRFNACRDYMESLVRAGKN